MEAYILSVSGAVLVSAVAVILLPEGKTGKFIGGILKLFCLLVILLPIPKMLEKYLGQDAEISSFSEEGELDDEFIDYMFSKRAEEEAKQLKEQIDEEFEIVVNIQIEWEYAEYAYNVTKVTVKIENFGIYGDDEHINVIEQVKEYVAGIYQGTEVEVNE